MSVNPQTNIYLIGLMGAGKTTVGRQLAKKLGRYQGFDRDGDGQGDNPHELYAYADQFEMVMMSVSRMPNLSLTT